VTLSKTVKECQGQIDEAFERLQAVTTKHDEKGRGFEEKLKEVGGEDSV